MRSVVDELKALIRERYPDASFRIARDPDVAHGINIWTTVDLDEPMEILDFIMDRLLDLQIEDGVPVQVVPVRTLEASARVRAVEERERQRASNVPVGR